MGDILHSSKSIVSYDELLWSPVVCLAVITCSLAELIIIIIMSVYYSCSQNATTEPTSVTQDSTDTIECKASIYNQTTQGLARVS